MVGTSASAEDISCHLYKFGAKHVILSSRSKPMNLKWPEDPKCKFTIVSSIKSIEAKTITFSDG